MQPKPADSLIRVAINVPLRKSFDYRLPCICQGIHNLPGCRVRAPFGNKSVIGVILEVHHRKSDFELKEITELLDTEPLLDEKLLKLLNWASDYYLHPVGEVVAAALPAMIRRGGETVQNIDTFWQIRPDSSGFEAGLQRAPRQRALYEIINSQQGCHESDLKALFQKPQPTLRALEKKGLIVRREQAVERYNPAINRPDFELNADQALALEAIISRDKGFHCHLLYGVTGSGKTEVYLRAAQHFLEQGKQVLVLVPEIGLTPQLLESFQQRFQTGIALLHSGLSDGERKRAWLDARRGCARIIIGTRSAVFIPLHNPGLIIVDEEHDSSFKQMEGFRYSARDVAIKRASMLSLPILLGSATPSLESLHNADQNKSRLLALPERAAGAIHPQIFRLDMRNQRLEGGLTRTAINAITEELRQDGQVLLFLNRRGYAPALICPGCGWVAECHRCDVRMTVHKRANRICCHVCSYERPVPLQCPDCGRRDLLNLGQGTERLEEFLAGRFPDSGVLRIDRDTVRGKHTFANMIRSIRSGQRKILLGTQMIAKGHHFPQVGTVIILDADYGIYGLDFRAQEHMAQILIQVAGRAGRASRTGKVYVQTRHPEHPFFMSLEKLDYQQFVRQLGQAREKTSMPPFSYLALLRAEARNRAPVQDFMQHTADLLRADSVAGVEVSGPSVAPLERKAGYFQMQILICSLKRSSLHRLLNHAIAQLDRLKASRRVRWSVDIDPYNLY